MAVPSDAAHADEDGDTPSFREVIPGNSQEEDAAELLLVVAVVFRQPQEHSAGHSTLEAYHMPLLQGLILVHRDEHEMLGEGGTLSMLLLTVSQHRQQRRLTLNLMA